MPNVTIENPKNNDTVHPTFPATGSARTNDTQVSGQLLRFQGTMIIAQFPAQPIVVDTVVMNSIRTFNIQFNNAPAGHWLLKVDGLQSNAFGAAMITVSG
jgi:hypothetical protein